MHPGTISFADILDIVLTVPADCGHMKKPGVVVAFLEPELSGPISLHNFLTGEDGGKLVLRDPEARPRSNRSLVKSLPFLLLDQVNGTPEKSKSIIAELNMKSSRGFGRDPSKEILPNFSYLQTMQRTIGERAHPLNRRGFRRRVVPQGRDKGVDASGRGGQNVQNNVFILRKPEASPVSDGRSLHMGVFESQLSKLLKRVRIGGLGFGQEKYVQVVFSLDVKELPKGGGLPAAPAVPGKDNHWSPRFNGPTGLSPNRFRSGPGRLNPALEVETRVQHRVEPLLEYGISEHIHRLGIKDGFQIDLKAIAFSHFVLRYSQDESSRWITGMGSFWKKEKRKKERRERDAGRKDSGEREVKVWCAGYMTTPTPSFSLMDSRKHVKYLRSASFREEESNSAIRKQEMGSNDRMPRTPKNSTTSMRDDEKVNDSHIGDPAIGNPKSMNVCSFGNVYSGHKNVKELKTARNDEYKGGHFLEAISFYNNKAIALYLQNTSCHNNKFAALAYLGRYAEAVEECSKVIDCDPLYSRAHHTLRNLYLRYDDGILAAEHAVNLDTRTESLIWLRKARAVFDTRRAGNEIKLGKWEMAVDDCNVALGSHFNNTKALLRRAQSNARLEHWEGSLRDYMVLSKEMPEDITIANSLAQDKGNGEISDGPDDAVDIYHTYFGVAGLSLLEYPGLKAIN
ncbi:hypothetical protein GIB67_021456 [Kingdonia uniflora]|uniref:Uncharacterized protein n=1 Tax=Kingdonia uniflora TaxID=39325 RepID=A0A7J7NQT9_9MAGN|nr:hypothetical protein GIB67_021456 [Kingdonia uniflora]